MFAGLLDIQAIIKRDNFKAIRVCLCFYPQYGHRVIVRDLFSHENYMLHHLKTNADTYAVKPWIVFLDENKTFVADAQELGALSSQSS